MVHTENAYQKDKLTIFKELWYIRTCKKELSSWPAQDKENYFDNFWLSNRAKKTMNEKPKKKKDKQVYSQKFSKQIYWNWRFT